MNQKILLLYTGLAFLAGHVQYINGFGVPLITPSVAPLRPQRHITPRTTFGASSRLSGVSDDFDLLQQARDFLTASELVYLYADLRELAYCGYLKTDFTHINCNNPDVSVTPLRLLDVMLKEGRWLNTHEKALHSDSEFADLLKVVGDITASRHGDREDTRPTDLDLFQMEINKRKIHKELMERNRRQSQVDSNGEILPKLDKSSPMEKETRDGIIKSSIRSGLEKALLMMMEPSSSEPYPGSANAAVADLLEGFASDYLKTNSMFNNIFKSDIELVYFHDRYPHKESLHAITVNKDRKHITVTFRGSATLNDWTHNIQTSQVEVANPVAHSSKQDKNSSNQQHDGKIGVHHGFYNFLQRERRDSRRKEDKTPGTKFDHILTKVLEYLDEFSSPGEEWTLCTTGHSLGGALATLFGFYAAADEKMQRANVKLPVHVFSFASPKVGDHRFRKAFKHLEEDGKLVHARFCVAEDFVPMIPNISPKVDRKDVLDFSKWKTSFYHHVGLQVKLHRPTKDRSADVYYPHRDNAISYLKEEAGSSIPLNLPNIGEAGRWHSLTEYQARLLDEIERERKTGRNELEGRLLVEYYDAIGVADKMQGTQTSKTSNTQIILLDEDEGMPPTKANVEIVQKAIAETVFDKQKEVAVEKEEADY